MKIISMEPTPSPYSLKVNMDQSLPDGVFENFKIDDIRDDMPKYAKDLFAIKGIKGLYRVTNFITIERDPKVNWEAIVPEVRSVFGVISENEEDLFMNVVEDNESDGFGEVNVQIQMIRHIPTQVKVTKDDEEKRFALPNRIMDAAMEAATAS